jgi:hypothetical protein
MCSAFRMGTLQDPNETKLGGAPEISASSRDGLYFVLIGAVVFIALGWVLTHSAKPAMHDFRTAYYSGKALLDRADPYNQEAIEQLYSREDPPTEIPDPDRIVVTRNPYLPSTFAFTVPLALFPERMALAIWTVAIAASFLLASICIWKICPAGASSPAGGLVGLCLATSASLFYFANPAGFVVPLCILACLSFIRDRFIPLGIAAFAVSLAFKPHDGGLILLYFLIIGGTFRKRALQTILVLLFLTAPTLLWLNHLSPQWVHELSSNMAAFSGPGHINDPRAPHGTLMMVNLQTITSFFWSSPRTYSAASLVICGSLLLLWVWITLHVRATVTNIWLAIASISALSLLPVYHRQYDAKLVLLQLPALCLLLTCRHRLRGIALTLTGLAIFMAGDIPWLVFLKIAKMLHGLGSPVSNLAAEILLNFSVPLVLLSAGTFYLWLYLRQSKPDMSESLSDLHPRR